MPELHETLARVPLFARLKPRDLERLAGRLSERSWNEGETVIAEGKGGVGFWVIEDGNATVSVRGEAVAGLGPGDHFGEIALLDDGPRSATVTAATDLRCQGLVAWEFGPFVQENPEVAWSMLQTLAGRLREAEARGEA
ncbi:MAG: cyclic nucleotide-binding domain-containing protein [Solirubrobacterales bacterium]|nr:cyclic nucleotide-binding domain-containing protein [Solirubrobacterales bacterium]